MAMGRIEFTMPFGGGETVATLQTCLQRAYPVPVDVLTYLARTLPLMVPRELIADDWHVESMSYSGKPILVRVVLVRHI